MTKTGVDSKRIAWIDASRGLAFLMVIYSHLPMMDESVMKYFTPVFLTTFFFVSGYLFKSGQKFTVVFEQRVRTLLVPFLILGLVMILLGQMLTFNEKVSFVDGVKGLLLQNGHNQILWFIGALFVYSVFFYIVDLLCRTPFALLAVSVGLFVVNSFALHWLDMPYLPWHISGMGCACFYMALGRLYRMYEAKIDSFVNGRRLAVLVVLYVGYIYIYIYNSVNHLGSPAVVDSMALTVVGLAILILISKRYLGNSRLLLFVGANSLFYFAFHGKAYSLILTVLKKAAPSVVTTGEFWTDLLVAAAVVLTDALILIVPAKAVNRYCPQVLGRGFKLWGRGHQSHTEARR